VIEARDGPSALQLVESYEGPIHLLVTDVVLPNMNGRDLQERLLTKRSGMKVLYMSGYPADVIGHHGVLEAGLNFIQKPFSLGDFANKVREVLNRG
jgi:DNA-binding response OmpR family regulator